MNEKARIRSATPAGRAKFYAWLKTDAGRAYRRAGNHKYAARLRSAPSSGDNTQRALVTSTSEHCLYCRLPSDRMELDHVVPIVRGGHDAPYNWAPACRSCNASKNGRDPIAWVASKGLSGVALDAIKEAIEAHANYLHRAS